MKHTILLVDDDASLLDGLCRTLRREPYNILKAGSAAEALELLKRVPVDVIVSDEEMPGISGTELLQQAHRLYPETVRFMLTGKATLQTAVDAINDGGISRFFLKPCDSRELAASIRQGLRHRELLIAARRLLEQTRRQSALIARLEKEYPHITEVERDEDGAIRLGEWTGDFEQLAQEIYRHLDQNK
jgi:DNA-binding NtrC family response regulator